MRCPHCDSKLIKKNKFCPECGAAVTWEENNPSQKNDSKGIRVLIVIGVLLLVAIVSVGMLITFGGIEGIKDIVIAEKLPTTVAFSNDPDAITIASKSVVKLNCYDKSGDLYATGSGFACFEDNVIVTNYHVIEDNVYRIEASTEDGKKFDITHVLATDKEKDIAILATSTPHGLTLLKAGDDSTLQKGEKVVAIGSPLGLMNSVSTGVFSGYVDENSMNVLQFTASISSGSSGGALFNDHGEVLGITFASYEGGQNLNLAIPIKQVEHLINKTNSSKMTVAEFYGTQTPTYTVDYVLKNYDELLFREFYIEGYVSVYSYVTSNPIHSWLVVFNSFNEIPHNGDANWQNFGGQITIDEEMHEDFLNVILYAENAQVWETIRTMRTGRYIRARGHIKTEYLEYGGVSMDIEEIIVID